MYLCGATTPRQTRGLRAKEIARGERLKGLETKGSEGWDAERSPVRAAAGRRSAPDSLPTTQPHFKQRSTFLMCC